MRSFILSFLAFLSIINFAGARQVAQITDEKPRYRIEVTRDGQPLGDIDIELFPSVAPKHCRNFDSLVGISFYDRTAFHRVIPDFMIQGGDPNSRNKPQSTWGYGDPSQTTVPAEFSKLSHTRGILSAARAQDVNSATSQFFICVVPCTYLDGQYSIYGQVVAGMNFADSIVNSPRDQKNCPLKKVEMKISKLVNSVSESFPKPSREIIIYPNPASDFISLRSETDDLLIASAVISDMSGKECYAESMSSPRAPGDIRIPISSLAPGIYTLRLTTDTGRAIILEFIAE